MKPHVLVAMLLMTLIVSLQMEEADAKLPFNISTGALVGALEKKISSLIGKGSVNILGYECPYKQLTLMKTFQLSHKVKIRCPGLRDITGEAHTHNPRQALGRAVDDLVRKGLNNHIIAKQQAIDWLDQA